MYNAFIVLILFAVPLWAQMPDETNGRVPELDAFHKPIYVLWHDAWPAKDIAALKQLYPSVDSAYARLSSAQLPGILRDKQQQWNGKCRELGVAVSDYAMSITGSDTARILRAAETVHLLYEQMVRIVRPVTPQIDAFHRILYSLHHYYFPEKNMVMIKSSAGEISAAMDSLDHGTLPVRWSTKKEQYERKRQDLSDGVKKYTAAVLSGQSWETLEKLERALHGKYLMLEKIFE